MIWRDFNVILAMIGIYLVWVRHRQFRHSIDEQDRAFAYAVIVLIAAVGIASAIGAYNHFPFTLGVPLTSLGLILIIAARVRKPDRFTETHTPEEPVIPKRWWHR